MNKRDDFDFDIDIFPFLHLVVFIRVNLFIMHVCPVAL